ncbi:hypothetical protein D9M69_726150 [compost metagenome]
MVTSLPSRATRAWPNGMVYAASGTSLLLPSKYAIQGRPMMPLWYMKSTGLSSRIAWIIRPLAS